MVAGFVTSRCRFRSGKAAKFFEEAFGMKRVGKAGIGCYVSDGTINVALLKYDDEVPGLPQGLSRPGAFRHVGRQPR